MLTFMIATTFPLKEILLLVIEIFHRVIALSQLCHVNKI